MSLTPKQEKFLSAYLKTLDIDAAAIETDFEFLNQYGFYVYFLADPRSKAIFYVGKGKGNRVSQHVKIAKSGVVDNAEKHKKITEILGDGLAVYERIFSTFDLERDALICERKVIESLRLHGLTNIVRGVVTNEERDAEAAKELIKRLAPVEWIKTHSHPDLVDALIKSFGSIEEYDLFIRKTLLEVAENE